jgi:hypothetical protein
MVRVPVHVPAETFWEMSAVAPLRPVTVTVTPSMLVQPSPLTLTVPPGATVVGFRVNVSAKAVPARCSDATPTTAQARATARRVRGVRCLRSSGNGGYPSSRARPSHAAISASRRRRLVSPEG